MPHYSAYQLTIASDLALPGLPECEAGPADVTIRQAPVDADAVSGERFRNWRAEPGRLLLELIGQARVLVEEGQSIQYERTGNGDDSHLISNIMGTGLAAILLQRELLPLHACCVQTDAGAVIVMGKSGAGKSTTLTGLLEQGCAMMADDVTAVTLDAEGRPVALPAFPTARLWQDVCERAEIEHAGLAQVREDMAKFYLPVERFHNAPKPIAGIIWLTAGNSEDALLDPLDPAERIEPLHRYVYRRNFLEAFGLQAFAFRHVSALAGRVPMVRYDRPNIAVEPGIIAKHMLAALGI